MNPRVLFIDDEIHVLDAYRRSLRDFRSTWEMTFVDCPVKAWEMIRTEMYDTIVTDVYMPRLGGLELLKRLRREERTKDIPVIVVTGEADRTLKRQALDLDATDLLPKPVDQEVLRVRLRNALRMRRNELELRREKELLEQRVRERTLELTASRLDIIWRLGKAAEFRDEETGNHVVRVACHARAIAARMGCDREFVDDLLLAAPLHDIGKIGIPDSILLKPGPLDDDERQQMRRHCEMGASILTDDCRLLDVAWQHAAGPFGSMDPLPPSPVLKMAAAVALGHHERWNGSGYPFGLSGTDIPLAARIVAVADVYDALRSRRPYKEPFPVEQALAIIDRGAGEDFDPAVVDAFLACFGEIHETERRFSDASATHVREVAHDQPALR
ncbi:MAG TPA: two-component system response regulator [Planctomycetaceae bacterium]|nr:two-component system response regulator [Planctomycetaceae bacterium]HRE99592.1 response regulator [Pirellulaceae bacterium]